MFASSKSNPVLNIIRENWDSNDSWGSAMAALVDMQDTDSRPATQETADAGLTSGQHQMLSDLRVKAGWQIEGGLSDDNPWAFPMWNYTPEQTPAEDVLEQHEIAAARIIDRLEDVARASGLNY